MNSIIRLKRTTVLNGTASLLPASKSIANRALIINALAGNTATLHNLSDANDTQLMLRLVGSPEKTIDVEDAGTTMRFLTAFFAVTGKNKVLTGTDRMMERPIALLVDALRELGATINYLGKEGYPPHETLGFSNQRISTIRIRGDVSSQYISALMMIGPLLPQGLTLELTGRIGSRPYIDMTGAIMKHFGVQCTMSGNVVTIPHQAYKSADFTVESDWSAASYWFSFASLAERATIQLPRLSLESLQGDSAVVNIMKSLGVTASMKDGLLNLTKTSDLSELKWDFTHCPDLAQTIAVVCAARGVKGHFTGLESLRIKETDRIAALQNELRKINADLVENNSESWTLIPSSKLPATARFATYKDHRMAMAFAPLAAIMDVDIESPEVVRKSYPNFWNDIASFGVPVASE
ncbi:3-phosphoshikimate 1-carboxyvinyltransferase [Chryseolinea sp. T2]|uniref:3-phosphoshikimate 1-carboxyvinyltransferase n=1 Tax=Chryseolinea sp. T2 TaxID=3129255 RepID=UPI003078668C